MATGVQRLVRAPFAKFLSESSAVDSEQPGGGSSVASRVSKCGFEKRRFYDGEHFVVKV